MSVECDVIYPIEREILRWGIWERETVDIIRRFVKPGDICMDIGANIGAISLAMAQKTTESGKVYAFEPGPVLAQRLKRNIALNPRFAEVIMLNEVGVSDTAGTLFWSEDPNNRGNAGLWADSGERVAVITIDEFARRCDLHRLNFVKIDVEGMEYEVLKGGVETWKRFRPILYLETMREFEVHLARPVLREIEFFLSEIGYKFYKVAQAELEQTDSSSFGDNTLALPRGLVFKDLRL